MENFLDKVCKGGPELSAEGAVDGEVGGAVDDSAEPHNIVENANVCPNCVGDLVLLG